MFGAPSSLMRVQSGIAVAAVIELDTFLKGDLLADHDSLVAPVLKLFQATVRRPA